MKTVLPLALLASGMLLLSAGCAAPNFFSEQWAQRMPGMPCSAADDTSLSWGVVDRDLYLELGDGSRLHIPSGLTESVRSGLKKITLPGDPNASRLAERTDRIACCFPDIETDSAVFSRMIISGEPDLKYSRFVLKVTPKNAPLNVKKVVFINAESTKIGGMKRVGYTDGSVLTAPNLYFGIEHPMAKVDLALAEEQAWTPNDFKSGEKTFALPVALNGSPLTVEFNYTRGADRLDIAAVQVIDARGAVVAEDVHNGFSGLACDKNVYTVDLPAGNTAYTLKCVFEKVPRTQSFGRIVLRSEALPACVKAELPCNDTLQVGRSYEFSAVIGTTVPGQERRGFQQYLEVERAHPYRVFPHYNAWYDICIDCYGNDDPKKRVTEEKVLRSMRMINGELFVKRGVNLESYLLDDGWDDWNSLWNYHAGFPNQFKVIDREVKSQNSRIGAWLSPWGGYNKAKTMRVKNAHNMGLETNEGGLSLSRPNYYAAFRDRCLQMIKDYDMNLFKFDGIGGGPVATGAPEKTAPDLAGLLRLIGELRQAKPDVFINCTVGTWPSPFWVRYADSIWRGGHDYAFAGTGNSRERWITYRDQVIYARFASTSPFYPLNSLMNHGVIVSPNTGIKIEDTPEGFRSFSNEVWMSVGCGTNLQEYYISPDKMPQSWWDELAAAITWMRANESTLIDSHWVGGDPAKGEVYGYASYNVKSRKAILVLRNPSAQAKSFSASAASIFELPDEVSSHGKRPETVKDLRFSAADGVWTFHLEPYSVGRIELTF